MVHALGIGDKKTKGMNCFAHEGLVRKVIGGHWVWSPAMQRLAEEEKIEAYILPGGVSSQLMREIGAGRPGLFTHVGLGTVCDPRQGGGRMNASAMLDAATQFDFYASGGLDIAFLGFGEFDAQGNVNVSRLGGLTVGPGGFIDIAQNAKKVVFCGTLAAKGVKLKTGDGQMQVLQQGAVKKLVKQVEQITFSGPQSLVRQQELEPADG